MGNLIERYVAAVIQQLPEDERTEVAKELLSNIYDMLSDQPSDNEIIEVLQSMGSPTKLAEQYRQNPRYLISPQVYDEYIRLLKLLVPIVGIITAIVGAVSGFIEVFQQAGSQVNRILQVMLQTGIQSGVSGILQTFVWTTAGFVIAERSGILNNRKQKAWTIEELPPLTTEKLIPVSDPVAELIATLTFSTFLLLGALNLYPVVFSNNNSVFLSIPLFSQSFVIFLIPVLIIGVLLTLIVSALKLIDRRWSNRVCGWSIVDNVVSAIMWVFLLMHDTIFSQELVALLHGYTWSSGDVLHYIANGDTATIRLFIGVLIVAACSIQIIMVIYYKSKRNQSEPFVKQEQS